MIGINVYKAVSLTHHVTRVNTNHAGEGGSEFVAIRGNDIIVITDNVCYVQDA